MALFLLSSVDSRLNNNIFDDRNDINENLGGEEVE